MRARLQNGPGDSSSYYLLFRSFQNGECHGGGPLLAVTNLRKRVTELFRELVTQLMTLAVISPNCLGPFSIHNT